MRIAHDEGDIEAAGLVQVGPPDGPGRFRPLGAQGIGGRRGHRRPPLAGPGPWLTSQSDYLAGELSFWGNTVTHAAGTKFVDIEQCQTAPTDWKCDPTQPALNLNTYKVTGTGAISFLVGPYQAQTTYNGFADYQQKTGQDPQSTFTQP